LECAFIAIAHAPSPQQLADLTNVPSKLPIEPDSNQIQAAFDRIVRMIGRSKDVEALEKLVDAAQNLMPKLDVAQAGVLLKVLLDILKAQVTQRASRSSDFDASMLNWGIAHTFSDLVPRLNESQIQTLLASLLKMLKGAKEDLADVIVAIVAALGSRLTDDQARQSLDAILASFPRFATSELSGMRDLDALAHRLSVDAASSALARITRMTNEYEQGDALLALVQVVSWLPIEPGPELIEPVVARLARALTSESDAYSLCEGLAALAPSFDELRANAALRSAFDVLSKSPDKYGRRAAARFMGTVAPRLNAQDRARALQAALAGLAMSPGADEAIDWATALEALIADMTAEQYIQWIISALKHPNCALETDNSQMAASVKPKFRQAPSEFVLAWRGLGVISGFRVLPTT
jgi:hypothetical protein